MKEKEENFLTVMHLFIKSQNWLDIENTANNKSTRGEMEKEGRRRKKCERWRRDTRHNDTRHNDAQHRVVLCWASVRCVTFFNVVLNVVNFNVIMLIVVMLSVVILNVATLNVVTLNVVRLNVVMLRVVAPERLLINRSFFWSRCWKKRIRCFPTDLGYKR
jgi:hypothetical protein